MFNFKGYFLEFKTVLKVFKRLITAAFFVSPSLIIPRSGLKKAVYPPNFKSSIRRIFPRSTSKTFCSRVSPFSKFSYLTLLTVKKYQIFVCRGQAFVFHHPNNEDFQASKRIHPF